MATSMDVEATSNDCDELARSCNMVQNEADGIVEISFHTQDDAVTVKVDNSEVQYKVDHLDLNDAECALLKKAIKTNFVPENNVLRIDSNDIVLDSVDCTMSIKRIVERRPVPIQNEQFDALEAASNTRRIQFTAKECNLIAKYNDELYLVDQNLQNEYNDLLRHTNQKRGTAVRIKNDRIQIYNRHGRDYLSIRNVNSYESEEIVVINVSESYESQLQLTIEKSAESDQFTRYVIVNFSKNKFRFVVRKVDPVLIHSSKYDICTEIYAELNPSKPIDSNVEWSDSESDSDTSVELDEDPIYLVSVKRYQVPSSTPSSIQPTNKSTSTVVSPMTVESISQPIEDKESEIEGEPGEEGVGQLKMMQLKGYYVPSAITSVERTTKPSEELLRSLMIENFEESRLLIRTNEDDYVNGCKKMIYFQEAAESIFLEKFVQFNVTLTQYMENVFYFPINEAMSELSAAIDENYFDWLVLQTPSENARKRPKKINGQMLKKCDQKIYIKIFPQSMNLLKNILWTKQDTKFSMHFLVNRTPFQIQHLALDFVKKHHLFDLLIKNPRFDEPMVADSNEMVKMQAVGKLTSNLNREQRAAVESIVNGKNYPLPYLLYGPPGTGKTRTLTAAIEQIIRTTNKNILVCTMSNSACDEIAERLIDVLNEDEIYRMYAVSYNSNRLKPQIETISNLENYQFLYPSLTTLYKYRVLICTLVTAGCLTRARIDRVFRADHFSYVFIDECSSAHETMALIPIAGLCTEENKIHANIVLAGDPKQLNAVTKSDWAAKLGHKISLLENLWEFNLYKRDVITGKFNQTFITQLVKNYRSHASILKIPNELFYENTLQSKALQSVTDWYINSNILPSKKFPILFKSVQGICKKDCDFSLYNDEEVDAVIQYLKVLLPKWPQRYPLKEIKQSDIGVATPYRNQRKKIVQKCLRYQFDGITVGTAEVFQGQEKPVMIVSTVRSDGKNLGFVSDPRRMNVIITRAKCLLIIIGDPHTLQLDSNWKRLLQYCIQNKSFIQGAKSFSI